MRRDLMRLPWETDGKRVIAIAKRSLTNDFQCNTREWRERERKKLSFISIKQAGKKSKVNKC
jgi:hypothetical protein